MSGWLRDAERAFDEAARRAPPVEPLAAACVRLAELDPHHLLAFWQSRTPGTLRSDARYRWELSHRIGVPAPAYAGAEAQWRAWRPGDQSRLERDPFEFEKGFLLPVVLGETAELLLELADTNPTAKDLLAESAFGEDVPPVAPRILVSKTTGRDLRSAREELGRGITTLKHESADPVFGVLVER